MKPKVKIILISLISLIFVFLIGLIMYLEIPRLRFSYNEVTDTYMVSRAFGNSNQYTIPKEHRGKLVTEIGPKAFQNRTNLEKLIIEDGAQIKIIHELAFYNCDSLAEFDFLDSIELIKRHAFFDCDSLKKVEFSQNSHLEYLDGLVFANCPSLEIVRLPKSLKEIGSNCFTNTNLERLELYLTTKLRVDALKGVDIKKIIIMDN